MRDAVEVNIPKMFEDYHLARNNLIMRAITSERMQEMGMTDVPSKRLGESDLNIVYGVGDYNYPGAWIRIDNKAMKHWGISQDQLDSDADRCLEGGELFDVLERAIHVEGALEMMGIPNSGLVIASTRYGFLGAGVIGRNGWFQRAAAYMKGSFYLLPSSIYEVMLLPDDGEHTADELESHIQYANEHVVKYEDILSNRLYHYDAESGIFRVV